MGSTGAVQHCSIFSITRLDLLFRPRIVSFIASVLHADERLFSQAPDGRILNGARTSSPILPDKTRKQALKKQSKVGRGDAAPRFP